MTDHKNEIELLPESLANQIAAGEVVESPASVVKELLENSIDAGATSITLRVERGGTELIQVTDNGKGMSATDARMCIERHATSKIKTPEDLFNIRTMGFRGEALAAISSVSYMTIRTKRKEDTIGTEIIHEFGQTVSQKAVQCPDGTTITIKNIFHTVPARKKFLSSISVETKAIQKTFVNIALAYPELGFSLDRDGKRLYDLAHSSLKERISGLLGKSLSRSMIELEEATSTISIHGYVVQPQLANSRARQYFFVNQRYVKANALYYPILDVYKKLLVGDKKPSYVLFMNISPKEIDINIHPRKDEIKFSEESFIFSTLTAIIKKTLGKSSLDYVMIDNEGPRVKVDKIKDDSPAESNYIEGYQSFEEEFKAIEEKLDSFGKPRIVDAHVPIMSTEADTHTGDESEDYGQSIFATTDTPNMTTNIEEQGLNIFGSSDTTEQSSMTQVYGKYILCARPTYMMLVHQRRAHMRILYEGAIATMEVGGSDFKTKLVPYKLDIDKVHQANFHSLEKILNEIGCKVELQPDDGKVLLHTVPFEMNEKEVQTFFDYALSAHDPSIEDVKRWLIEKLALSVAKHLAIKVRDILTQEMMTTIVTELERCTVPNFCPEGGLTTIKYDLREMEKRFEK